MRLRLVAGAAALMLLAGCTSTESDEPETSTQPEVDATAIPPPAPGAAKEFKGQGIGRHDMDRLTARATKAMRSGDERAFVSLFDPRDKQLVEQQRTWFRNIRAVPMKTRELKMVQDGNLLDSSGKREMHADMGFFHQVTGADLEPVAEWYRYSFVERDGRVLISGVGPTPPDSASHQKFAGYYRQAWDDGPMTAVVGSHSILLGPASDEALLRSRVGRADAAVRSVVERFRRTGSPLPKTMQGRKLVFTLPSPSVTDFFDYFGGRVTPTEAAFGGFASPVYPSNEYGDVLTNESASGTRVVIPRDGWLGGSDLDETMRHEIVHAAQDSWQRSLGHSPTWVTEGLAVYFSDASSTELSSRRDAGRAWFASQGRLPDDEEFYSGDNAVVGQRYGAGYLAIAYLADKYGEKKMLEAIKKQDSKLGRSGVGDLVDMTDDELAEAVRGWAG